MKTLLEVKRAHQNSAHPAAIASFVSHTSDQPKTHYVAAVIVVNTHREL